jgi:hypothetical protein
LHRRPVAASAAGTWPIIAAQAALFVVDAVDPGQFHAVFDEVADQFRIGRGLGWQGDHDAGLPMFRGRPEQLVGPPPPHALSVAEPGHRAPRDIGMT